MTLAALTALIMVVGLVAYIVLGGADFGAGFWDLTAGGAKRGDRVRGMIHRSMAPVWEANHVWLIFVLALFWTAFPQGFTAVMTTCYVPLFVAAIGIVLRGVAFAVRGEAATIAEHRALGALFACSSVLIPFSLGATVGAVASGRVPAGGDGDALDAWWNPTSILIGALTVATGAYLAAVYLAGDSQRAGLGDLVRAFRARALGAAVVAGTMAIGGLAVLRSDARHLYDGLTSDAGLAFVLLSALAGVVTIGLVWRGRFEPARYTGAAAVAAIGAGWLAAQWPDLLPGELTVDQAAAGKETLAVLLIGVAIGAILLVPSLWYLFRLVLSGRLDKEFHPITAGEEPPRE